MVRDTIETHSVKILLGTLISIAITIIAAAYYIGVCVSSVTGRMSGLEQISVSLDNRVHDCERWQNVDSVELGKINIKLANIEGTLQEIKSVVNK